MLVATFDEKLGLIVTVATGFQSEQEVESHLATMDVLAKTARARTGRILHLVDATEAAVQPPTGSRSIMKAAAKGRIKVDRCAVVMASTLGKMQTMRLYGDLPLQVFDRSDDAIAWLQAFQPWPRLARAISSQMKSSDDSEIAVKQYHRAVDPIQSDRKPL